MVDGYSEISRCWHELAAGFDSEPAVRERSKQIAKLTEPLVGQIQAYKENWQEFSPQLVEEGREKIKTKLTENPDDVAANLQALGLAAAVLEQTITSEKTGEPIQLRPDQLAAALHLRLKSAEQYKADAHNNVALEKPTGEGKTFVIALAAATEVLAGKNVHIITPSYYHAQIHAGWLGEFYKRALGEEEGIVGVAIDKTDKKNWVKVLKIEKDEITGQLSPQTLESYVYDSKVERTDVEDLRLKKLKPVYDRRSIYQNGQPRKIVITDRNAVAFDLLRDYEKWENQDNTVSDLDKVTAIIDEGDQVLDEAISPWIIARDLKRADLWEYARGCLGFDEFFKGKDISEETARELASWVMINIWRGLDLVPQDPITQKLGEDEFFKKIKDVGWIRSDLQPEELSLEELLKLSAGAEDKLDGLVIGNQVVKGDSLREKIQYLLKIALYEPFSLIENLQGVQSSPEQIYQTIEAWLDNWGWPVVDQAVHARLALTKGEEYINTPDKPVLVDQISGLPLENRKLQEWYDFFLQLKNGWRSWVADQNINESLIDDIMEKQAESLAISYQTDRLTPVELYAKYGSVKFVSGTLAPSSQEFADLFGADTIVVARHKPIDKESQWRPDEGDEDNALSLNQIDGGPALVKFYEDSVSKLEAMVDHVATAQTRPVLVIVNTPLEAEKLRDLCQEKCPDKQIKLASAQTELAAVDSAKLETVLLEAGKKNTITIATVLASRGVEVNLDDEAKKAGGLKLLLAGLMPNRRVFLQSLGRALRTDNPGERIVFIAKDDPLSNLAENKGYLLGASTKLHEDIVQRMALAWQEALSQNQPRLAWEELKKIQSFQQQADSHSAKATALKDGVLGEFRKQLANRDYGVDEKRDIWSAFLRNLDDEFPIFGTKEKIDNWRNWQDYWRQKAVEIFAQSMI